MREKIATEIEKEMVFFWVPVGCGVSASDHRRYAGSDGGGRRLPFILLIFNLSPWTNAFYPRKTKPLGRFLILFLSYHFLGFIIPLLRISQLPWLFAFVVEDLPVTVWPQMLTPVTYDTLYMSPCVCVLHKSTRGADFSHSFPLIASKLVICGSLYRPLLSISASCNRSEICTKPKTNSSFTVAPAVGLWKPTHKNVGVRERVW